MIVTSLLLPSTVTVPPPQSMVSLLPLFPPPLPGSEGGAGVFVGSTSVGKIGGRMLVGRIVGKRVGKIGGMMGAVVAVGGTAVVGTAVGGTRVGGTAVVGTMVVGDTAVVGARVGGAFVGLVTGGGFGLPGCEVAVLAGGRNRVGVAVTVGVWVGVKGT